MLTVVVPMAGEGRRFREAGFDTPKPFVDVAGRPMLARVLDNLPTADHLVLVVRREHRPRLAPILEKARHRGPITCVPVDQTTAGPAASLALALRWVDPASPLLCADCDQVIEWDADGAARTAQSYAGLLVTFRSQDPAFSYAEVQDGRAVRVAEKTVISPWAVAGAYFFASARLAASVLDVQARTTSGEQFIAPAYNHLLRQGRRVGCQEVSHVWSLGTPEALHRALVHGYWGPPLDCGQTPRPHAWGRPPDDHPIGMGLTCKACGAESDGPRASVPCPGHPWREV